MLHVYQAGYIYLILLSWLIGQLLYWSGGPGHICCLQAHVWSPAGLYRKCIINLDLSERRPICCSRLTAMTAVRPEEEGGFTTCSLEARFISRLCAGSLWVAPQRSPLRKLPVTCIKNKVREKAVTFESLWISHFPQMHMETMTCRVEPVMINWLLWWISN